VGPEHSLQTLTKGKCRKGKTQTKKKDRRERKLDNIKRKERNASTSGDKYMKKKGQTGLSQKIHEISEGREKSIVRR